MKISLRGVSDEMFRNVRVRNTGSNRDAVDRLTTDFNKSETVRSSV